MNTKDLSGNEIVKRKNCWNADPSLSWDQNKVYDRESRSFPRKIKETVHTLKNADHINNKPVYIFLSFMIHFIDLFLNKDVI